jgi:YhcH/YjgK/YiaL family protein
MEVGRYDIDGDKVFALVQEKTTQLHAPWESHDHHIDLQFSITGQEKIGYYPVEGMKAIKPYDAENDFTALEDVPGDFMTLRDDIFMLLFPVDGHLPAIAVDQPMDVKKVVIKIKC